MLQRFSTCSRVPAAGITVLPVFSAALYSVAVSFGSFCSESHETTVQSGKCCVWFQSVFPHGSVPQQAQSFHNMFPFFWSSLHILFLQDPLFPEACTSSHGFSAYTLSVQRETRKLSISDLCAKAGNRPEYLQPGSFSWKPHPVQMSFP